MENAKNIDALHINHHSALDYAFDWAQTKQGHDYWRVVYEDLKDFGMASQFLVFNHSRPVNEGLTSW